MHCCGKANDVKIPSALRPHPSLAISAQQLWTFLTQMKIQGVHSDGETPEMALPRCKHTRAHV